MKSRARALLFAVATACGLSACQSGPPETPALQPALRKAAESGYVPQRHYATTDLRQTWRHDGQQLDASFIAPSAAGDARFPLLVYLPGLGEPASSSALWRRAWAEAGYAVLAVQPLDLTQRIWASPMALAGDFEGLARKEYSAQSAAMRIDALKFALGALRRDRGKAGSRNRAADRIPSRRVAGRAGGGDHAGDESCPLCVNCIGAPPAVRTIHTLLALRFASTSGVVTVYATHFPSGETCAPPTRCIWIKSLNVMACLPVSCALTPDSPANSITTKKPHSQMLRFITSPP